MPVSAFRFSHLLHPHRLLEISICRRSLELEPEPFRLRLGRPHRLLTEGVLWEGGHRWLELLILNEDRVEDVATREADDHERAEQVREVGVRVGLGRDHACARDDGWGGRMYRGSQEHRTSTHQSARRVAHREAADEGRERHRHSTSCGRNSHRYFGSYMYLM